MKERLGITLYEKAMLTKIFNDFGYTNVGHDDIHKSKDENDLVVYWAIVNSGVIQIHMYETQEDYEIDPMLNIDIEPYLRFKIFVC